MAILTNVVLSAQLWQDEQTGVWIGWCAPLDLYSQGATPAEAHESLQDAAELYIKHTAGAVARARKANPHLAESKQVMACEPVERSDP